MIMNENERDDSRLQALEKRTKLLAVLLVVVLALSAANLAFQFVGGRFGGPTVMRGGDFPAGEMQGFPQGQGGPQGQGEATE